jgi:secreted trypsin-like serine protease
MKSFLIAAIIGVSVVAAGCGGGGDSPGGSCSTLKITNGDNCDLTQSPVALVLVQTRNGVIASCSGTVISPTAILTAAHCVINPSDPIVDIAVGVPAGVAGISNGTIASVRHDSRYTVLPNGALVYDQAVIRTSFDTGANPVPLLGSDSITPGEEITVFGYGRDEQGRDIFDRLNDREFEKLLKAGRMVVDALNPVRLVFSSSYDSTGQSVCPGDSGGPAIVQRGGRSVVGGIVSYGSIGSCQSGSFAAFGNVGSSDNLGWIRGQVPEAEVVN